MSAPKLRAHSLRARLLIPGLVVASGLLISPMALAQTTKLTFDGYTGGASAVGVDDPQLPGGATWQASQSGSNARFTATSVAGSGSPSPTLGLRLLDDQNATGFAYYLDLAGATGAVDSGLVELDKTFTVSFDLRLGGYNATTGTDQAWIHFGRSQSPGTSTTKNWLYLRAHGSRLYLVVDGTGGARTPVDIGPAPTSFIRLSITINPTTKRYENVTYAGMDVTSIVLAQSDGTIPWRASATDTNPVINKQFWLTSGANDYVVIDIDNLSISNSAEPWPSTAQMPAGLGDHTVWLPYLTSSTNTKIAAGSALDLGPLVGLNSESNGGALIDERGFALVNQAGDLSFANHPGTPHVRFFCAAEVMLHFPVPDGLSGTQLDTALDTYVDQLVRAGYNAYRPHFLDVFLMQGSSIDKVFNPARLDVWHRLVAKLRAKGIYLAMDASTSWNSFYKEPLPGAPYNASTGYPYGTDEAKAKRLNVRMFFDATARDHWKAGVTELYTNPNPYTQKALKDDPQVIFSNLRNEASITFRVNNDSGLRTDADLLDCWQNWLRGRYENDIAKLNAEWAKSVVKPANKNIYNYYTPNYTSGNPAKTYASFDVIPIPELSEKDYHTGMYRDFRSFDVDQCQALYVWMQQTMRAIGVTSLLVDNNVLIDRPAALIRDTMPMVDNHIYHDHGDSPEGLAWTHDNTSVTDTALGMVWQIAQTRLIDRPMTVTEWGQPYWSSFRHEAGLAFPAYASFQNWSMIAQHARPLGTISPANLAQMEVAPARVFQIANDPAALASERMAALLYGRGDVKTAEHSVALDMVDPLMEDEFADRRGVTFPFKVMTLLTRFGLRIQWPKMIADDFSDSSVESASEAAPDTGWAPASFWAASGNGTAARTITNGKLSLTAQGAPWAYSMVGSSAPAPGSSPLNIFDHTRQFFIKGLQFETNPSNGTPAYERVFRFAIASGSGFAQNAQHSVILEVFGHNRVRLGFKVNGSATYQYRLDTTLASAPRAISLTPIAANLAGPSSPEDNTYDLVVHLDGTDGAPAYQHFTGRWNTTGTSANDRLDSSNWNNHAANTVQLQAQKYNGANDGKFVRVLCDEFAVFSRQRGPHSLDLPASLSWNSSPDVYFDTVFPTLQNAGIIDGNTLAPTLSPPEKMGAPEIFQSGQYQSDTGELFLKPASRYLTVDTDRSEGAIIPAFLKNGAAAGAVTSLPNVKITNLPAPDVPNACTVLVSSLEAKDAPARNVENSGRLLLIVSTDAINTGQNFQDYRRLGQLINGVNGVAAEGAAPVLLRRTKLEVRIRNVNAASMEVYPLRPDGTRRPKMTTTVDTSGEWLVIPVDTGALTGSPSDGPAIYFEIARP